MIMTRYNGMFVLTGNTFVYRELVKRVGFHWNPGKKLWWTHNSQVALELINYADANCRAYLDGEFLKGVRTGSIVMKHVAGWFYLRCPQSAARLPQTHGFRWSKKYDCWVSPDTYLAAKLAKYADAECLEVLTAFNAEHQRKLAKSRAADASIDLPVPAGLQYFAYQRAGIAYALDQDSVLIADEMGVGKTIQAIGVINCMENPRNVLIVCPASLKLNWRRECMKWLVHRTLGIHLATSQYWPKQHVLDSGRIVIVNYDILEKLLPQLTAITWDVLIADECHKVKNPEAIRTKAFMSIQATKRLMLTGTPIVNRPRELYSMLKYLDPVTYRNWTPFRQRYCDDSRDGASNLEELQDRLRGSLMIRRLKSEVLADMPPKLRQIIEVPASRGDLDAELMGLSSIGGEGVIDGLISQLTQTELTGNSEDYAEHVGKLKGPQQLAAFTELARIRHETALAKVPAVIQHIKECLESTSKIVVFAHHKDVVQQLAEAFDREAVTLTGDDAMDKRQQSVDRFQEDSSVRVFIGSITAAGVGLTLTAASHVVFAELDWVPANMSQAEDRCHRIGQNDTVIVQHVVLEGSLDARIASILVEKQEIIDRALDREYAGAVDALALYQ